MKKIATALVVLFVFSFPVFAQIDPHEINSFGTIANFSESDLTWVGEACGGAANFEIIEDPDDASNMIAAFVTSACNTEGFVLQEALVPLDFRTHYYISLDVNAPAADRSIAIKLFNSQDPNKEYISGLTITHPGVWDTLHFEFDIEDSDIYDRISIHPDWYGDSVGEEWLFDNLRQDRELL
ncbi:hypothetical protein JW935_24405, partial [candidate division KSB1 bacterium]|nr:hypothetical protein [candidate division KSB1 bacterium]